jgi:glycosyltransferase involved in cell wall biosynthesis
MENNYLISVIIPCYNDAKYIEQSVLSALNQTYQNKEIIVVDDGSNAETKEILRKIEPLITKLIIQENQGQSVARNIGIREAKGDYILVLDSDDYFETTFCEKAVAILANNKDTKIVTCQANLLFEDGSTTIFTPNGGTIADFLYSNNALGTSLFRKKDWKFCGGYDQSMKQGFEDWEFFIRLLKNGGKAEVIHEPLYNYRKRKNSTTFFANKIKYELLFYIFIKHKELFVEDYENFVQYLLEKIKSEEKIKIKYIKKSDNKLLNYLRNIKNFIMNRAD